MNIINFLNRLSAYTLCLVSLVGVANADSDPADEFHRALRLAIYADQSAFNGMYPGRFGSDGNVVGLHRISLTASSPFDPCKFDIFSSVEVNSERVMTGFTTFDLRNDSSGLISNFERERWVSYTETNGVPMATSANSPAILKHSGKGAFDGYFVLPSENKYGVSIIDAFENLATACR